MTLLDFYSQNLYLFSIYFYYQGHASEMTFLEVAHSITIKYTDWQNSRVSETIMILSCMWHLGVFEKNIISHVVLPEGARFLNKM